jgi:hypothetical protein
MTATSARRRGDRSGGETPARAAPIGNAVVAGVILHAGAITPPQVGLLDPNHRKPTPPGSHTA